MKKYLLLLLLVSFSIQAQIVNIPDTNLKTKLLVANTTNNIARNQNNQSIKIDVNNDGEIQESEATLVYHLDVSNSGIVSLEGIQYFSNIRYLVCYTNSVVDINPVMTLSNLINLMVAGNNINHIDFTNNTFLNADNYNPDNVYVNIDCSGNPLITLNMTGLNFITNFYCNSTSIELLDFSNVISIQQLLCLNNTSLETIDFSNLTSIQKIFCNNNTSLETINFSNLTSIQEFQFNYNTSIELLDLSNLTFIQDFECNNNTQLEFIDFGEIINLSDFECGFNNSLQELNFGNIIFGGDSRIAIGGNPSITELNINLATIDLISIGNNSSLSSLVINLSDNINNSLFISSNINLESFTFNKLGANQSNPISSFDVLQNSNLIDFTVNTDSNNNLEIDNLSFWDAKIEELDLNNINYNSIQIYSFEELETLNIKNGNNIDPEGMYSVSEIPNLSYICANESEVDYLNSFFLSQGLYVNINTYCSFIPGGEFFIIQGNSKLDISDNGCDENDIDIPNMKFNITNGTLSGTIIFNSANYSIPMHEGVNIVTPVIENPTYFNVNPSNVSVNFPTESSPFTQNFCITPNGNHQDLEVTFLPIGPAQPGFDSNYKIIYKNKGTLAISGYLVLNFMDNFMDFVSSNPMQDSLQPNLLTWNYTDLQPFEIRIIDIAFNLNSPQEIPALVAGADLGFSSIIFPIEGDEYYHDNYSDLKQKVVNSYDPNDKTCLEGSVVSTELIGQYVHYVIRFENTGTFFAQNVVVKDEIDLTKFDLSTLIPLHSSHDYFTRINGNKVEFIFENIQLPFPPSEERHGYIAFKIKLKNDLSVGDTFSNFASIYFDYNFPIITEPVTTTIQALSNPNFEFSSDVKLYPNPARSSITIEGQSNINLKSVEIFNSLGQLIQAIPNENNQLNVDVSQLQSGTYFIKVYSDKGVGISKFVKQ